MYMALAQTLQQKSVKTCSSVLSLSMTACRDAPRARARASVLATHGPGLETLGEAREEHRLKRGLELLAVMCELVKGYPLVSLLIRLLELPLQEIHLPVQGEGIRRTRGAPSELASEPGHEFALVQVVVAIHVELVELVRNLGSLRAVRGRPERESSGSHQGGAPGDSRA